MLDPTRVGKFGENNLTFVTPDDAGRFVDLLKRLNVEDSDGDIVADGGDAFGVAPIHAHISRFTRPDELQDDSGPEALVEISVFIDDIHDREDHVPEQMLELSAVLIAIGEVFPEPMHCHHSGRLRIPREDAHTAIDLPINVSAPQPLGEMLGARFELNLPSCEPGHIILDAGEQTISVTLHFDKERACTVENIHDGWATIRDVYNKVLLGEETEDEPHTN